MKVLELFAGERCIGRAFEKRCPKMYDTFINKLGLGEMFRKLGLNYE